MADNSEFVVKREKKDKNVKEKLARIIAADGVIFSVKEGQNFQIIR